MYLWVRRCAKSAMPLQFISGIFTTEGMVVQLRADKIKTTWQPTSHTASGSRNLPIDVVFSQPRGCSSKARTRLRATCCHLADGCDSATLTLIGTIAWIQPGRTSVGARVYANC